MAILFQNSVDMSSNPIVGVVDSIDPTSAITKTKLDTETGILQTGIDTVDGRVDTVETNLSNAIATLEAQVQAAVNNRDFKDSVQVAATANVNLASGVALIGTAIQGVTLSAGVRVLLTAQTDASQNGIYVVAAGVGLQRSEDANADSEVTNGMLIGVTGGDLLNQVVWMLITADAISLGTTELTFQKFRSIHDLSVASATGLELTGGGVLQYASVAQARKTLGAAEEYSALIGNGVDTTYTVTHNLNTDLAAMPALIRVSDGEFAQAQIKRVSANAVSVTFGSAPASNAYKLVMVAVNKAA
jgi:hypothetical protein